MTDSRRRQIAMNLGHTPAVSRDDLVVTASNRAAVELVDRWPDWPGPVALIVGPPGSGKSHLAAIWQGFSQARSWSGESGHPPNDNEAIVLDDADRAPIDENALFHLINQVRAAHGFLLMTARHAAPAWGVRLPDLASRLRAATTVTLDAPDDTLLEAVVTKLFSDRQLEVDAVTIQFMVRRMERSLAAAGLLVERIDRLALERKTRVRPSLVSEAIADVALAAEDE